MKVYRGPRSGGRWSLTVAIHSEKAPSKEALIQAVEDIADHYRLSLEGTPKIGWIKWDSI